jgi:SAM-dependent methyltransferase
MTRTEIINSLIAKYGYSSYLEIGLQNPDQNYNKIKCAYKSSVDPDSNAGAEFCMTSDQFFENYDYRFDVVFIDGLHHADQVQKDFNNALRCLNEGGLIVLHDTNPEKEIHTIVPRPTERGHWNGDVFKFAVKLADSGHSYYTVDCDNGVMCVFPSPYEQEITGPCDMDWVTFDTNRGKLLNLVDADGYFHSHSHI